MIDTNKLVSIEREAQTFVRDQIRGGRFKSPRSAHRYIVGQGVTVSPEMIYKIKKEDIRISFDLLVSLTRALS